MRVVAVSPSGVLGGAEDVFRNLVTSDLLDARAVLLRDGPLRARLAECGVDATVVDAGRLRDPRAARRAIRELTAIVRESRPDVVYANQPKAHFYTALAARRAGVPAWWCQVNVPARVAWLDRAVSLLPAAGVVAPSRAVAEAQRRIPRSPRVVVVHPGTDTARFRPDAAPAVPPGDLPLVGVVGRLQAWKGQALFLRAAALLRTPARFAVVGGAVLGTEGDYARWLRDLARDLGLDALFPGHVADVPGWLTACDVVVNASWPEPFGLVVTEAMACGRAVVAFATGGPAEIVTDGVDGVLVAEHSPAALAAAIDGLLADPSRREALGAAARRTIEERFSVPAMVSGYVAAFRGSA